MGMSEEQEDTPLHEGVRYSDPDEVRDALKAGHDPNQIGLYQWSALHEAAHIGDEQILKQLLNYGGDPNKPDLLRSCTALHYAASAGHAGCLHLLLEAGGQWDATDRDGKTSLDVATGDCIPPLRKLSNNNNVSTDTIHRHNDCLGQENTGDAQMVSENCSRETIEQAVLADTKPSSSRSSDVDTIKSGTEVSSEYTLDPDEVSLASLDSDFGSGFSPTSSWSPQAWSTDGPVLGVSRKLVLGQILLSFEYNSKKSTFKIRAWQVTDLLLPPFETSMISGIYIMSYLFPDKRKESKRKTEEVPVYKPEDKVKKSEAGSRSTIFKPSSFQFTKAPEYKKVTAEMVRDKMVNIEVCIVQKYTRRSYVLATWNMPMKEAVKKLVKQNYPLTPRISTELPENMKVYDGSQLTVTSSGRPYSSYPNTRAPSTSSLQRIRANATDRAASETDLKSIQVDGVKKTSSIEITVPNEEEDELQHALQQITIMERAEQDQWTSIPMSIPDPDEGRNTRSGSHRGSSRRTVVCDVHDVAVHMPDKVHSQSYANKAFDWKSEDDSNNNDSEPKKKRRFSLHKKLRERTSSDGHKKEKGRKGSATKAFKDDSLRPESPTWQWDNYMEPLQLAEDPITFDDDDFGFELDMPVLPMTTSLDLPRVHGNSFSKDSEELEEACTSFTQSPKSLNSVVTNENVLPRKTSTGSPNTTVNIPEDVTFHVEKDTSEVNSSRRIKAKGLPQKDSPRNHPKSEKIEDTGVKSKEIAIELSSYPTKQILSNQSSFGSRSADDHELDDIETILV